MFKLHKCSARANLLGKYSVNCVIQCVSIVSNVVTQKDLVIYYLTYPPTAAAYFIILNMYTNHHRIYIHYILI